MMLLYSIYSGDSLMPLLIFIIILLGSFLLIVRNVWEFRWNQMRNNPVNSGLPQIPKIKMMKVQIPFTFRLHEISSSDNEINCIISSQNCYKFMAFWGVSIRELHMFLWLPWAAINRSIEEGILLHGNCQEMGLEIRNSGHEEKVINLSFPPEPFDLGTPPRSRYPLVIVMVTDSDETPKPEETVALINIIHLKDPVCSLPTSILAQYLKQASGQLSCLKQLYLACVESENENCETDIDLLETEESHQLCVVCRYLPLSRALLPCRHTCVCGSCFNKLKSCPLCRSPIRSYFCIKSEDYLCENDKNSSQKKAILEKLLDLIGELLELEEWVP